MLCGGCIRSARSAIISDVTISKAAMRRARSHGWDVDPTRHLLSLPWKAQSVLRMATDVILARHQEGISSSRVTVTKLINHYAVRQGKQHPLHKYHLETIYRA